MIKARILKMAVGCMILVTSSLLAAEENAIADSGSDSSTPPEAQQVLQRCEGRVMSSSSIDRIDHLIYFAPDLESGMDDIEKLLGVRPIVGGHHPDYGTHNALLAFGPTTYLEIIAADPDLPAPSRGKLFAEYEADGPRLLTWVMREENIDSVASFATAAGVDMGAITPGKRQKSDGSFVSWKASDPYAMHFDGPIPFMISWGDTPHPATSAPLGGCLLDLTFEHPSPDDVKTALAALGVQFEISKADQVRLVATIKTANGVVQLK